jgi:predicted ATPase
MTDSTFIRRVILRNYKSIARCDITLRPLSYLVGQNGAGKSNFLDALHFVRDALTGSLDNALSERGGLDEVRRRSSGHPNHFAIRIDLALPDGSGAHYSFRIGAAPDGGFRVTDEECRVASPEVGGPIASFRVHKGDLAVTDASVMPAVADDRLYLVAVSGMSPFRRVYDALTSMGFYNLSPAVIRDPQQPDAGTLLRRDGGNLASVLGHLARTNPAALARVTEYLRRVAPGVEGVSRRSIGPMETIEFRQRVEGRRDPWAFMAASMSDGTLRGLGVLVALLQSNGRPPTLVGIEEPEVALHPAAVAILIDAIRDASRHTQVVVTSHSPELLDHDEVSDDALLAVVAEDGVTVIGPVSELGRGALQDHLFTAGELLRMGQLEPSEDARGLSMLTPDQLKLFGA